MYSSPGVRALVLSLFVLHPRRPPRQRCGSQHVSVQPLSLCALDRSSWEQSPTPFPLPPSSETPSKTETWLQHSLPSNRHTSPGFLPHHRHVTPEARVYRSRTSPVFLVHRWRATPEASVCRRHTSLGFLEHRWRTTPGALVYRRLMLGQQALLYPRHSKVGQLLAQGT